METFCFAFGQRISNPILFWNNFRTDKVHIHFIRFTKESNLFSELSMEERERAHATQLQRAERESTSLRGEIKQIRSRMEAAIHQAAESDQLRAQIRERYPYFSVTHCTFNRHQVCHFFDISYNAAIKSHCRFE